MMKLNVYLILVTVLVNYISAQEPVNVSIYYSTLSKTCKEWITSQFTHVYEKLSENIILDYVPYGNSTYKLNETPNIGYPYEFSCENGIEECTANTWHACAVTLHQINNPEHLVNFVNCTMWEGFAEKNIKTCAATYDLDYIQMKNCADSLDGNMYSQQFGNRTHAHNPKIGFFPTIVFNNKYSQVDQESAIEDFSATLCKHLHVNGTVPEGCKSSSIVSSQVGVMTLLLCWFIMVITQS